MSECTHDCANCSQKCSEESIPKEKLHPLASVKKVIGIVSGKGGVGKSAVTSLFASEANRRGLRTAILDADITGPSIPEMFGVHTRATGNDDAIFPVVSESGVQMMSINLLLENETDPVVWRGPVIAGTVKQFWTDVIWDQIDIMFIDMPPGTGDVPLTIFQSLPIDGIIIVTSPQQLVSMIVEKAMKMAKLMNVPILGIVENMSYAECECGRKLKVFGESNIDRVAAQYNTKLLAELPIDPKLASLCDNGKVGEYISPAVKKAVDLLNL